VGVEGSASFEVAPGKPRPFRVSARQSVIVAIGTSFSVRDYPADSGVTIDVIGGAVEIHHGDKSTTLASGDSRFLSGDGSQRAATPSERDEASGWVSGTLTIDNRPLRDVLPMLGRWYGMSVKVPDASLLDRRVTVRASLDSAMQVIRGNEAASPKGTPAKGAATRPR
jgi:transmembrane sensor